MICLKIKLVLKFFYWGYDFNSGFAGNCPDSYQLSIFKMPQTLPSDLFEAYTLRFPAVNADEWAGYITLKRLPDGETGFSKRRESPSGHAYTIV